MFSKTLGKWLVMVAACITLAPPLSHAQQVKVVSTVEGWKIKSRANADGKFLACSMERFFLANKGEGRFRLNIIAWPESVIVLLRGNNGFIGGEGVGQFEIVSNQRPLFTGKIRFQKSEVLFALNGRDSRRDVANSSGWSVSMDGKRVARFPMTGAAAAMAAVEKCAGLDRQVAARQNTTTNDDLSAALEVNTAPVASVIVPASSPVLADKDELTSIAQNFSREIGRPDYRVTRYDSGVLQWVYGDKMTSGAAMVTQQTASAGSYAAGLAIRPDQCADSVLTLPLTVAEVSGGEHAAVVSMCRGKNSVTVRHVHVVTRGGGATYVLNYETEAEPNGTGMPERSDVLARAFFTALSSIVGG